MFGTRKPLIGVIHLPPLPGCEESPGLAKVIEKALADLAAYSSGAVDAVLVENEGDRPLRVEAARETISSMTRIVHELASAAEVAVGVEVLLNDPEASLAIALASNARFIRTDYFVDPMERSDFGVMRADPDAVTSYRSRIGADHVALLADLQVKHARLLVDRPLEESAAMARARGADAVVVTGSWTGVAPSVAMLEAAKRGAGETPVLVGSGLAPDNAEALLEVADGAIFGTSVHTEGLVDAAKVEALVDACRLRG